MTTIEVTRTDDAETRLSVRVIDDDGSASSHEIVVPDADWERFGHGFETREQLIEASFAFLLEREPKESILGSFELNVIVRYFPDFPAVIAR
jgi:hypothetical protein